MADKLVLVDHVQYQEYPEEGVQVPDIGKKQLADIATFIE